MFSKKQKSFFLVFLLMTFAVTLTLQLSGHFGSDSHTFFNNISASIIVSCLIIHLVALKRLGVAPEMLSMAQFKFILKSTLAAIILIQLFPSPGNFSMEYASPIMFMLVYSIAMLSVLFFIYLGVFIFAISAIIALAYFGVRTFSKKGKQDKSRAGLSPGIRRFFRSAFGFGLRLLIVGIIFTGFIIDPKSTNLAALCFVFMHVVVNIIYPAIRRTRSALGRSAAGYLLMTLLAAAVFSYFHRLSGLHPMLLALLYATGAGGMAYSLFTPRRDWINSFNRGVRELLAFALLGCLMSSIAFAINMMKASESDTTILKKIKGVGRVYDVYYSGGLSRLYFTTRDKPYLGYIDLKNGNVHTTRYIFQEPRRIAVFPEYGKALVGSVYGTREFALGLIPSNRLIFKPHTIDVEKMGKSKAILAQEIINNIMIYDVSKGSKRHITLPVNWAWIYAVKYSEELNAIFVSNWFFSPFVHRIEGSNYKKITQSFNGFMNVGMCVLPDRNELLVARPLNRRIDALNAASLKRMYSIPTESGIREIDCDKRNALLFTISHFQGTLTVFDLRDNKPALKVQMGTGARALSYDEENSILYLGANSGIYSLDLKDTLEKINESRRERNRLRPPPHKSPKTAAGNSR